MGGASVYFFENRRDGAHRELVSRIDERAMLPLHTLPGLSYQKRQDSSEEDGDDNGLAGMPWRLPSSLAATLLSVRKSSAHFTAHPLEGSAGCKNFMES